MKSLKKKNEIDRVTIKGRVTAVCPKKGCWVTLENTQNVEVFVKMKDYALFLPQNIAGKTILLDAKVTKQETSVKELRHYAEDAGKSKEEIAKITKPKTEIRVLANGINFLLGYLPCNPSYKDRAHSESNRYQQSKSTKLSSINFLNDSGY